MFVLMKMWCKMGVLGTVVLTHGQVAQNARPVQSARANAMRCSSLYMSNSNDRLVVGFISHRGRTLVSCLCMCPIPPLTIEDAPLSYFWLRSGEALTSQQSINLKNDSKEWSNIFQPPLIHFGTLDRDFSRGGGSTNRISQRHGTGSLYPSIRSSKERQSASVRWRSPGAAAAGGLSANSVRVVCRRGGSCRVVTCSSEASDNPPISRPKRWMEWMVPSGRGKTTPCQSPNTTKKTLSTHR